MDIKEGWGKRYTSDEEAIKGSTPEELTLGLLHSCMNDVTEVVEELVARRVKRQLNDKIDKARAHVRKQMVAREEKHGPCSDELESYLMREAYRNIFQEVGSGLQWNILRVTCNVWIEPPPKYHPLRKEYDRWMKRRPKKETK